MSTPGKRLCPACVAEGKRSRLWHRSGSSRGWSEGGEWDEDGEWVEVVMFYEESQAYECSEGHRSRESVTRRNGEFVERKYVAEVA